MQNLPAKNTTTKVNSQSFIFNSMKIRAAIIDGEPWFVAKDVCNVLEIQNVTQALGTLDPDELTYVKHRSGGQRREMNVVNESGLYALIFKSRKPEAKAFRKWVTSEVLPALRKTGSYAMPQTYEEALEELLKRVKEERILREQNAALLADNTRLEKSNFDKSLKIAHDRGNVQFALAVRQSESTCLVGTLANYLKQNGYKTGPVKFFEYLRNEGWLSKQKGEAWNRPTKKAMDAGFFKIKMNAYTKGQGEEIGVSHTPVLTMKGMQFFVQKLLSQTLDNPLTDSASGSEK